MKDYWFSFPCPNENDLFFIDMTIFNYTGDTCDCFGTHEAFQRAIQDGLVKFRNGKCYILFTEVSE